LTSTGVGGRNGRERHTVGLDNLGIERKGHMSLSDPVLTGPRAGRTVTSGHGSSTELKLAGEQSGGDWAVVEWRLRAGDEPPIHIHTREDETLYVLEGAITAFVGDQRIEVEAGSYAALPKDVPHGLSVRGEEVRLLVTLAPAGAEYFFVPRDENDADPARFGVILKGPAMAAA
jgi:quercetin dioxygenase-like cupin family protein